MKISQLQKTDYTICPCSKLSVNCLMSYKPNNQENSIEHIQHVLRSAHFKQAQANCI